ncbi:hypothetical protein [Bradyrhizobium genosp. A]|uniref:hypothetical protein n=1 Tax=Bradyrhizobium genosp. A TaxID=83626 RepID=UPI003CEFECD2
MGKRRFENLRYFKNWPTMGIAYAAPDMQGGNFWGVINHDNEEGIIRIADNTITPGLKMWTWGVPSFTHETDARQEPNEWRPYIELWAGVSDQFFHSADLPALGEVSIPETYSPTVGMSNVTHANENILINLSAEGSGVTLQLFSLEPATPLRATLKRGDATLFDDVVKADPKNGNRISATIAGGGRAEQVQLTIRTPDGKELMVAETRIKMILSIVAGGRSPQLHESSDAPSPFVNIEFHQAFVPHFQKEGLASFLVHDISASHDFVDFEWLFAKRAQDIFSIIQHD